VLAAARRRFSIEGSGASLRDIARDANVNLGLVHRYFGSKDTLIRAVFSEAAESGQAHMADVTTFEDAFRRYLQLVLDGDMAYVRIVAGQLLAGKHIHELQTDFPTVAKLLELAGEDRRPLVLLAVLATNGWQMFSELATSATGYASEADALTALLGVLDQVVLGSDRGTESAMRGAVRQRG
jgi:AcrR family transcriptional regulator